MSVELPERPEIIGVRIETDFGLELVVLRQSSVNGLVTVNPQKVIVSFDQWIQIGCQLQLRRLKLQAEGLTTKTVLSGG